MNVEFAVYLKKCLWLAIILFIVRGLISINELVSNLGIHTAYTAIGYAGEAIAVTALFMAFYEKRLWRYDPFCKIPKLQKQYHGIFKSSYDDIERTATLEIKQTLLSVNVIFSTGESKSNSVIASIDEMMGEYVLTYCYLNKPNSEYRDRSAMHYGTAMLYIDNPENITGQYYTDRMTRGDLSFSAIDCKSEK